MEIPVFSPTIWNTERLGRLSALIVKRWLWYNVIGFRTAVQEIWAVLSCTTTLLCPPSVIKTIHYFPNGDKYSDDITAAQTGIWQSGKGVQVYGAGAYKMLNLNMTGGHAY